LAPTDNGGSDITNYKIYRWTPQGKKAFVQSTGNALSYTDLYAFANKTYYYKITAVNDMDEGPMSTMVKITMPESKPAAPLNLLAKSGNGSVDLTWDPPVSNGGSTITNYKLYRGTASTSHTLYKTLGKIFNFTDNDVTNGLTYYYKVSAVNKLGEGPASAIVKAVPQALPSAPQNLKASPGDSFVLLTWNAPLDNGGYSIKHYKIYKGTSSGNLKFEKQIGNVRKFNDTSVTNSNTYFYKVSAVTSVGEGALSTEVSTTPTGKPGKPQYLGALSGDSYIRLEWKAPEKDGGGSITNYRIYRGSSAGQENFYLEIGNVLNYNDTNVTNGKTYYYKVTAKNDVGERPLSNGAYETPYGKPGKPLNFSADAKDTFIKLTWTKPLSDGGSKITNYRIYKGTKSDKLTFLSEIGNIFIFKDANIINNTNYYYKVSAKTAIGEGPGSDVVSIKYINNTSTASPPSQPEPPNSTLSGQGETIEPPIPTDDEPVSGLDVPSVPTNIEVIEGDGYIKLSWESPEENGSSEIIEYKIYKGTSADDMVLYTTVDSSITTFYDYDVEDDETYFYYIIAVNEDGESDPDSVIKITPENDEDTSENNNEKVNTGQNKESTDSPIVFVLLGTVILITTMALFYLFVIRRHQLIPGGRKTIEQPDRLKHNPPKIVKLTLNSPPTPPPPPPPPPPPQDIEPVDKGL
jgi:fibronectin type 3 domain-containing protein